MEHWERHKAWHKEKDAKTAAVISNSEFRSAQDRRDAAEMLAAARDEYERLVAQSNQLRFDLENKAAAKLAKKAIELDPQRPAAYYALASAFSCSGDDLRASECYCSAIERAEPDSEDWAQAVFYAWESRRCAAPCRSLAIFCGCERCAALPAKPAWMATPEALLAMSERVVAAAPGKGKHWKMHASAHWHTKSWPTASKSYAKAARLFGDQGNESGKAAMLGNAQAAREYAEAEAEAAAAAEDELNKATMLAAETFRKKAEAEANEAAEAEAAHMAAREAAANAAMEALLAEEAQEKAAAAPVKPRKGKGKGRKK
jgi:hypothetical protein